MNALLSRWNLRSPLLLTLLLSLLFTASPSLAYLSIGESAELLPANYYQMGFEPQFFTDSGGGANATAFFDTSINDSTSGRLWLGTGVIDLNVGASVKYVPFPDVDTQPGIGFRAGAFFSRKNGDNSLTLQVAPLFSKKVNSENGLFIPYAAVALDFTNAKEKNFTGTQIMFGTEYKTPEIPKMYFGVETGFNLSDSYSYISGTVTFPFDSSKGLFE